MYIVSKHINIEETASVFEYPIDFSDNRKLISV